MIKKLLSYYQQELATLHRHGSAFARQFPKVAQRLGMSEGKSEDPHIERLIESFALLTAQIHQRLDDDMPEVTRGLMQTLAPQLLRNFPSVCIVQMQPDRKASGMTAKKMLSAKLGLTSRLIAEQVCRFETLYPVTLQPLDFESVTLKLDADAMNWCLKLNFAVWPGASVQGDSLRVYLNGNSTLVNTLHALLLSEVKQLSLIQDGHEEPLPVERIGEVGFDEEDALFNRDGRVNATHSLLHDYVVFPQKFHFIDLPLSLAFSASDGQTFQFHLVFNRCSLARQLEPFASQIDSSLFQLNCTPAVNLFSQRAEPINLNPDTAEYPVIADVRAQKGIQVWSVDRVMVQRTHNNHTASWPVAALLGLCDVREDESRGWFWQELQRATAGGNACHIAFADRSGEGVAPQGDIALLELTCSNGEIPTLMSNGCPRGDFDAVLPLAGIRITALTRPTVPQSPPGNGAARWRLLSQLTLNHLLLSGSQGCQVLKQTLSLYNFTNNPAITRLIELITALNVRPVSSRLIASDPHSLARGVEIIVTFSADAHQDAGHFMLCRFLDHFLALYAPVNSFSRLVTVIDRLESSQRQWPIRAGRLSWI
jgi:type VI secretion system protein ImpG